MVTAKGAPGATTSALAMTMAWPRPVLLIEGDPCGSDLRWSALQGTDTAGRNLLRLAQAARHGLSAREVAQHVLSLDEAEATRLVLPGPPGIFHGPALLPVWPALLEAARQMQVRAPVFGSPLDVLVDCGRLDHPDLAWPAVERADLVLVALRATMPSIMAAQPRIARLREVLARNAARPVPVAGLVVTEGPYTVAEIERNVVEVAATLPHDPAAAQVLSTPRRSPRGFTRSQFMRSARAAACALIARGPAATPEKAVRHAGL
jgi:cellulose biosynthesis protein BcsQ